MKNVFFIIASVTFQLYAGEKLVLTIDSLVSESDSCQINDREKQGSYINIWWSIKNSGDRTVIHFCPLCQHFPEEVQTAPRPVITDSQYARQDSLLQIQVDLLQKRIDSLQGNAHSRKVQKISLPSHNVDKNCPGCYGIGNVRIKLILRDTIYLSKTTDFMRRIDQQGEWIIGDDQRLLLSPGQKISGTIGGFFEITGRNDTCSVELEYNSLYQQNSGKPIWRSKLVSEQHQIILPKQ